MIGRLLRAERLRAVCLAVGGVAALAMIVVGCQSVTRGTSQIDAADAPLYRASVSSSSVASVSSSRRQEAERRQELTSEAIRTACEALSSSSVDAIAAVNVYVRAYNDNAPDVVAQAGPAIDMLNRSADLVESTISELLSPELKSALGDWVQASRAVAAAVADDAGMAAFNDAGQRLNDSQDAALALCDAAYRANRAPGN